MRSSRNGPAGQLHTFRYSSELLKGNLLGDPVERTIVVYVPNGHDGNGLPLLVDLVGYTGSGLAHVNWKGFGENLPEQLDRLIHEGVLPPVAVAFPDCFTRLGGNQYINSTAMGPWEDILITEMVPLVERQLGCGGTGRRGVFGKSSGGYGAVVHAMHRPDFWSAAACHAGDMAFELCHLPMMPDTLRALAKTGGSVEAFLTKFEAGPKWDGDDIMVLMTLAMAATYDPDPSQFLGIRLPVDLDTCQVIEERWANWLAWDPLNMFQRYKDNLKDLKALWIDCGSIDQYDMVYGARRFHRLAVEAGIDHVYEEFEDNHSGIDYRLDKSLPYLAKALSE